MIGSSIYVGAALLSPWRQCWRWARDGSRRAMAAADVPALYALILVYSCTAPLILP